jgi:predicted nucleic acid-binding protein
MSPVVADTGPLNYLILVQAVELLPRLFSSVLIPAAVKEELAHPKAPPEVRSWLAHEPPWLNVVDTLLRLSPSLSYLGAGEHMAIELALERQTAILLMDDRDGVREARERGLEVVGTLAVLDRAAAHGWVNLPMMFRRLSATSFRAPLRLMIRLLEEDARRKT